MDGFAHITKVEKTRYEKPVPVYNFHVKDWASYFVGQVRVYVHNGGEHEVITTNLNNKIDITPSSNHISVYENPGPFGTPNSSVDILNAGNGNIKTRRWYDSSGAAYRDARVIIGTS